MPNANDHSGIDFYEAQQNVGDSYFLFTIQKGETAGGGVSCYFWFESFEQMINSIRLHMDFWDWENGFDEASKVISQIIDTYKESSSLEPKLLSKLNEYCEKHAGVHLWECGTYEDLCLGQEPFSLETRSEFREWCHETDQFSYVTDEADGVTKTDPISEIEQDLFLEFLAQTPT